jgi:2'-5' RNA ligase
MNNNKNKRLFFALDINEQDKALVAQWRTRYLSMPFKAIAHRNFHITLAFLGNTSNIQQHQLSEKATTLAQQISPIAANESYLTLNSLGLFKKPKVLYLGLQHCPLWLSTLAQQLSQTASKIGLFQENRPYCPHLSIYRKATHVNDSLLVAIGLQVQSFSLYESISSEQGVVYTPIKTWRLIR